MVLRVRRENCARAHPAGCLFTLLSKTGGVHTRGGRVFAFRRGAGCVWIRAEHASVFILLIEGYRVKTQRLHAKEKQVKS